MVTEHPRDQDPDARSPAGGGRRPVERDLGLAIDRDGTWFYRGSPIRRPELVKLFASVLRREADGGYWLQTPVERGRIAVEDVPFVAVELAAEGHGRTLTLRLRTNLDEWVSVGAAHPLRLRVPPWQEAADAGPAPYVVVRPGLEARLARAVFYELAELAEPAGDAGGGRLGVWSGGEFFPLDAADGA